MYSYHVDFLTAVAISPDNQYVLTSGIDQRVYLIHTFTGELKGEIIEQNDVMSLEFSNCGTYFITGGKENIARLYLTDTLELVMT